MNTLRSTFKTGALAFAGTMALLFVGSNTVLAAQAAATATAKPAATAKAAEEKQDDEIAEVVITGTLIRGIAPVGANAITVTKEDIKATGATSALEVLATLPNMGGDLGTSNGFNYIPVVGAGNSLAPGINAQTQQRPSLRANPGASQDSGNSTLILVDGNRTVGAGVNSNSAPGNSVPPALLERLELNTDGASAIYGSDAIAGVINYVTVRKFVGNQFTAKAGTASSYHTWDMNAIVGRDWGSKGTGFISYGRSVASKLFNKDRDYVNPIDFATGLERDLNCDIPNVRINANTAGSTNPVLHYYASTSTTMGPAPFTVVNPPTGAPNVCRSNRDATLSPQGQHDNVLASYATDIGPVKITIRGRYNFDSTVNNRQIATYTATINNTNPYWRPVPGEPNVTSYSVLGSFANAVGRDSYVYQNSTAAYGGTIDLAWDVGGKWQVRGTIVNEKSNSDLFIQQITAANQTNGFNTNAASTCSVQRTTAACLNPFNIAASDPALVASLLTSQQTGKSHDYLFDVKVVSDGPLFHIPGGDVRAAFGVEYYRDEFGRGNFVGLASNIGNPSTATIPGLYLDYATLSSKSAFAEFNVPIVSADNARTGLRELRLSASGRYDDYSRFGSTFNPKLGLSYKPVDWLKIRGSYNESFRAPTTVDILGTSLANTTVGNFALALFPAFWTDPTRPPLPSMGSTPQMLILQGTSPNLQPQTGRGYSFGLEFTPLPRFLASLSYYRTDYMGQFAQPGQNTPIFPYTPQFMTLYPTSAEIAAFKASGVGGTNITIPDSDIYGLLDTRKTNLGNSFIRGVDYAVRYSWPTGFGSIFGSVSGNYQLDSQTQPAAGSAWIDNLAPGAPGNNPSTRHKLTLQLGLNAGGFRGTATVAHTHGYGITQSAAVLQNWVTSYDLLNLAGTYDFMGEGLITKGLQLSLTVNNAFDQGPPTLLQTGQNGYTNGSTLGRVFVAGFTKKF